MKTAPNAVAPSVLPKLRAKTFDAVTLPLQVPVAARSVAKAARERLVSLDAMRGFAVLGMIVVNTLAFTRDTYAFPPSLAFLAHSRWAGFIASCPGRVAF